MTRNTRKAVLGLSAFAMILAGCSGVKDASNEGGSSSGDVEHDADSAVKITVSSFEANPELLRSAFAPADERLEGANPTFTVNTYSDGSMGIFFSMSGGGFDIRKITGRLLGPDGSLADSAATDRIETSGTYSTETRQPSVTTYGHLLFAHADRVSAAGSRIIVEMASPEGSARWSLAATREDTSRSGANSGPLEITVTHKLKSAGVVDFHIRVKRLGPGRANEYMPTAENFRIELRDQTGEVIWNSSSGMMFAQMIGPVLPPDIGGVVEYDARWNGRADSGGRKVEAGRYFLAVIIPARPVPYSRQQEFDYGGE